MSVTIRLSASLAGFVGGRREIPVSGTTVKAAIHDFAEQYPNLAGKLLYPSGEIREFANMFVNETDIRDLDGPGTSVKPDDVIAIIPGVAGG